MRCRNKMSIMYDILDKHREKRLFLMKNSYKKGATRIVAPEKPKPEIYEKHEKNPKVKRAIHAKF